MKNGYTLIELLIVITIIGILFSAGYLSFLDYSRQQALLSVVRGIQVDMHLAEDYAISGNKPTACNTLLNGYNFNVTSSSSYEVDANCTPNSNFQVKTVTLPAGITISAPVPNPILFKSLAQGTNIAGGGTASIVVTQTLTGKTRTVTIGANGNVQ
jgi:prepilin-type N-terminal cleavage/methylation domain-containing protein